MKSVIWNTSPKIVAKTSEFTYLTDRGRRVGLNDGGGLVQARQNSVFGDSKTQIRNFFLTELTLGDVDAKIVCS